MKVWCLFEQSGTFKNVFKKYGIEAIDVDYCNDFHETDIETDLFKDIDKAYSGQGTIFEDMDPDDLLMVFFPCTRFTEKTQLLLKASLAQMQNWDDIKKLEYSRKTMREVNTYYQVLCKLWIVVKRLNLRMIVENPCNPAWSLSIMFPIPPTIVHPDRSLLGDYFEKSTQYWFVNCTPKNNFFLEDLTGTPKIVDRQKGNEKLSRQVIRSMISPVYADRFVREYILDESQLYRDEKA